jgi:hypothetical protein
MEHFASAKKTGLHYNADDYAHSDHCTIPPKGDSMVPDGHCMLFVMV